MKLLVTGAEGFIGKNLCAHIEAIGLGELLRYDKDTDPELLDRYAVECDFVFHLAGVNRPVDESGFEDNVTFTKRLIDNLERQGRAVPVLISSSVQARLDNPYGRSKKEAETVIFDYAGKTGAEVYVFRLPGVFGKWCSPHYNNVVATFCYDAARGLPLRVDDPGVVIEMAYIDDVVKAFLGTLSGKAERPGGYCVVPETHHISVGHLAEVITAFSRQRLTTPDMSDKLTRQLYSTYISFLPEDVLVEPLTVHRDSRGAFAECVKSVAGGQVSVNTARPGVAKGGHWHHTKTELFVAVSGEGIVRLKILGSEKVLEYPLSAERLEAVTIPPGYIHEVKNTGVDDLVLLIWASEVFDPQHPDTYAAKMDD